MRFFVDETSFELPPGAEAPLLERHIEAFIRLVNARHKQGEDVFKWSNLLEEIEVQPGVFLVDLLYQRLDDLPLDKDTQLGLQQALNRCVHWDERLAPAPEPMVEIDGVRCRAPTVSIVHHRISGRRGAACLALGVRQERTGVRAVRIEQIQHEIHFVTQEAALPAFYRTLFEIENLDPGAYMLNAPRAFPALFFAPGLASQFSRFQTPYLEVRPHVTKHLAVLNDHFQRVHRESKDKTSEVLGAYGIDASLERGKTHKNKDAMRQRHLIVEGVPVICEWHTKIKRHVDRIYFDPGDPEVAGGRLIIGFFKDHFDL